MHVLVHEIQNGEPEGSKGWQGQQRREVLEENLEKGHMEKSQTSGKPAARRMSSVNLSKPFRSSL